MSNHHRLNVRQRIGRELIKAAMNPLLRWRPLTNPEPGFSLILGVPWDLRHLLGVNLRFVARTDTSRLRRVHVVFDRPPRPGAEELIEAAKRAFPGLPLTFRFHNPISGWLCNKVNVSTFYNSMNTVLGIGDCTTRHVVLHDFDLYPIVPNYFTEIVAAMERNNWRFSGLERTYFDGLTDEDNILGTWALGIDAQWIRARWRPIDGFHRVAPVVSRLVNLDPYSYIQTKTPERGLAGTIDGSACCHVKNLCSTYLRVLKGVQPQVVWRLHYLWYLEHVGGQSGNFQLALSGMREARDATLAVGTLRYDFSNTHWTCSNVLRDEVERMERFLYGDVRPEVGAYLDAFAQFLSRFGSGRDTLPAVQEVASVAEGRGA